MGGLVATVPTAELGREWLRTTAAPAAGLDPGRHQSIVRRPRQALDELERRNPAYFSRWLAQEPDGGSDPADCVAPGRTPNADAA